MHILLANNVYPPIMAGGAELVVAWLGEGLVARGHRVTVVSTCAPDAQPYPVETRNGVTVIRFFPQNVYWNFARQGHKPLRRMLWHLRDAWNSDAGRKFQTILNEAPPDIVHTHLIDGFSAAIWNRAHHAGIPIVHTAHDYHLLCPRAFLLTHDWRVCRQPQLVCRLYRSWHLRTTRYVDLFVSPSRFLLEMHQRAGLAARETAVIRNGIPHAGRVTRIRSGDRPRFLLLTRLTEEKGIRVVLRAVASLPRSLEFQLIVAGRGPLEQELRAAAAQDQRIQFAGYVTGEPKDALLASAHYLLIPSLWFENAPVTVIEAATHGLAVIASRIGGLPELVRDGATGFLFEPGDANALATIMSGLLSGDLTLPDLAIASSALAERHSVAGMVSCYLACYRALVADPARAAKVQRHHTVDADRAA